MKKRVLSALMALVMVFSLMPMSVFAETGSNEDSAIATYLAGYAKNVSIDGTASEIAWNLNGKLTAEGGSESYPFDILWDAQKLYLQVKPGSAETELTFAAGNTSVTISTADQNAGLAVWGDVVEASLDCSAIGITISDYSKEVPVTVTCGDHTWSGNVILTSNERLQKATTWNRTDSADDPNNTTNLKTHFMADGGLRFTRLYGDGAETTDYDAAFYNTGAAAFPYLVDGLEHTSIEFDFVADAMPAYNSVNYLSAGYAARGFSLSVTDGENNPSTAKPDCLSVGITNSNGTMYFIVGHGMNLGSSGSVEAVSTGKSIGERFHVQMLVDNEGNMSLYIDGQHMRTFKNAVIDNYPLGGTNNGSIPVIRLSNYGKPDTDGKKADGSADVDFTIWNFTIGNTQGNSVLDAITFDAIKGDNTAADAINSNLVLPTSIANPHLGTIDVEWSSSNEDAISTTGVVKAAVVEQTVTLTAALANDPTVTRSFELTIPAKTLVATLVSEEIVIDGVLNEGSWEMAGVREFTVFNGLTAEKVCALWDGKTLYFAIVSDNANEIMVELSGRATTMTVGNGSYIAKQGNIVEMQLPLSNMEVKPQDYDEAYLFNLTAVDANNNSARLESESFSLILSGDYYEAKSTVVDVSAPSMNGKTGSSDSTAWNAAAGAWKHNAVNGLCYWLKTDIAAMDHSLDVLTEIKMNISAMPEGSGTIQNDFAAQGVYLWVSDLDRLTPKPGGSGYNTNGYYSFANIYNSGSGALTIKGRNGPTVALGKKVGDTFTLGYLWKTDDSVDIYVDGVPKGTIPAYTKYVSGAGADVLQIRAQSPVSGSATTVSIYSVEVTASGFGKMSLDEELAPSKVLEGVKLTGLTNDDTITLPGTWETMLGTITLEWASSNDYITLVKNADGSYTGTVHQPMTKVDVYTDLILTANGKERWDAEATVVGLQSGMETTADTLRVPFTAAGITLDGATTDEGWSLDIKVLKNNAAAGYFGAQWTKDNLYMAVDTKGAALSVNINGQDIDLSGAKTSGNIKEFAVAFSDLGVALEDYGEELSVKVTIGDAVWVGTFVLTSTDWFLTDGVEPRMNVAMKGTTTLAGTDKATANQGFEDLGNGWRLFDLYDPAGNNPARIRTYLICWARDGTEEEKAVFKPLDDRTTPTYTEFDFLAKSMPIYTPGTGRYGATGWSSIFSNYGLTWNVAADSDQPTGGNALSVSMGIYNTEEGLMFCVLGKETVDIPLNKRLGDQFRLGTSWNVDGSLTVYVDGVEIAVVENAETMKNAYGDESVVINLIRNPIAAAGAADSFDIYITNISIGKSRGESIFDALSIDDILGANLDPYAITTDLVLPESIYDDQLEITAPISWTISEPTVVAQGGAVTRPANGGKVVNLTATWNGMSKTFEVYVKGLNYTSNTRVVFNDLDTANGGGKLFDSYYFTLDTTNNSIIYDQGSSKAINLITLTDGDASNRLNESCLTIWVSDNNIKYTQVEGGFKIKKDGDKIYLYDFTAAGRYIKVHCTHYLGDEADFTGPQEQMLQVEWNAYLDTTVINEEVMASVLTAPTETVKNETNEAVYDEVYTFDLAADTGNVHVYQLPTDPDSETTIEQLYAYCENGKIHVRVPMVPANGEALLGFVYFDDTNPAIPNLDNKEYTLEVAYGTRETRVYDGAGRWIVELPDGRLMAVQSGNDGVTENYGWLTYCFSYNYGMTWTDPLPIPGTEGWLRNGGGMSYDPHSGRIIVEGYEYKQFVAADVAASDCKMRFVYSDDLGETWVCCPDVTFENGKSATYYLSYSDPVFVSSYDGEGPNIDVILNCGVQYDDTGSFCCRVAFSKDAGKTWTLGDDEIRYTPGQGILAYEGGVSEGTILEVKDENGNGTGKLVLYARCQYDNVDVFCKAYSYDYGANWTTAAELTDLYTVNTQPIMHEFGDAQLMFWGGNNVLGGNSYQRMPMNVAISRDGLESFEGIQDLYARYSLQGMTTATRNQIINQSVANEGDTVTLVWDNNFKETLIMRVDNFTDWFYRTKGIWDSFENTTTKAEGWSTTAGIVATSDAHAKEGNASMKLSGGSSAVRTVPYLQNGTVSFDLYLFENPKFQVELESAYGTEYGKAAPMGFSYEEGKLTFLGDENAYTVPLNVEDWNNFTFQLDLDATTPMAELYVNGEKVAYVPVNTDVGDYVCWLDLNTQSVMYLDCLYVDDNDFVVVPEAPEAPAETQADLPRPDISVSLTQSVVMNFYVRNEWLPEGYQFVVKRNGKILNESQYTVKPAGVEMRVSVSINANHLGDVYSLQVVDAEGNPVTQDRVMSVRSYVRLRLNNPLASEYERRVFMQSLDYGALAQLAMNANAVDMANRYLEEEDRVLLDSYVWPEPTGEADAATGSYAESRFSVTASLQDTVVLNFYIATSEVKSGYGFKILCNGTQLTQDKDYTVTIVGQEYCISVPRYANQMCDIISAQLVDANGDAVYNARALSLRHYVRLRLDNVNTGDAEKRVLIAAMDYGALAQLAMNNKATNLANRYITEADRAVFENFQYPSWD